MRLSIIQEFAGGGYAVLDEHKSSPRLAGEIGPSGELSTRGIQELLLHLREFISLCAAYRVDRLLTIGTAALRLATNQEEVCAEVERTLGLQIDIVSGEEEARLGYSAVMHTLLVSDAYLIDIGGGSTEVTLVKNGRLIDSHSFGFGAVTLSKIRSLHSDDAFEQWRQYAEEAFAKHSFINALPSLEVIGIGGTIRSIARVNQTQEGYPLSLTHNFELSSAAVTETLSFLSGMPLARRRKIEGLSKDRADLILPGGAILLALLARTKAPHLRVSGRGLRDGAFYARRLDEPAGPVASVLDVSITSTLNKFGQAEDHANHVAMLAGGLFAGAVQAKLLPNSAASILHTAAMLHRIGVQVSYYHYDRHTFYLIMNSSMFGLTHREIVLTAATASYKGRGKMRKLCLPYMSLLRPDDLDLAASLGVLVRLAEALDRRHIGCVSSVSLRLVEDRFELWLAPDCEADVELSAVLSLAPLVKKVYQRTLKVCK